MSATRKIANVVGRLNAALYKSSGGKFGATMKGAPILLLTTTGRKTGKPRTNPLLYLYDGDAIAVVASVGGAPQHPTWFLNLKANPAVEVQIGKTKEQRRAREATPEERERLWPQLVAMYGGYAQYQQKTTRTIPVVLLER